MLFSKEIAVDAFARARGRCVWCRGKASLVLPLIAESDGGADDIINAVPLCERCSVIWNQQRHNNAALRQMRDKWWRRCALAFEARPLGLALSGGGFRATAFHLGVLKRLRELKILHEVDVISTVSGGSIAGAYWVYWQSKNDTLDDDDQWTKFEASLIAIMKGGLRERVLLLGLGLPALTLVALVSLVAWWIGSVPSVPWAFAVAGAFAVAYVAWHYLSTVLLEREYRRLLFGNAPVKDLARSDSPSIHHWWPKLVINCSILNSGRLGVFTHGHTVKLRQTWQELSGFQAVLARSKSAKEMSPTFLPEETPLAIAVATSSCFPGAFTPLRLRVPDEIARQHGGYWYGRADKGYSLRLLDGGVLDNQGTYALQDARCKGLLISDASAGLAHQDRPSTWQLIPLGQGVYFRMQALTFEQVRTMGRRRIADWERISRGTNRSTTALTADQSLEPLHQQHAFIDLRANDFSPRGDVTPVLSEVLNHYVSLIRTDMDGFSTEEISALMFHGYSVADHVLRDDISFVLPGLRAPFRFRSADSEDTIQWEHISPNRKCYPGDPLFAKQLPLLRHLEASRSRSRLARYLRRRHNEDATEQWFLDDAMGLTSLTEEMRADIERRSLRHEQEMDSVEWTRPSP
jgi:predicted acylesterase/phospholipase RssA